MQNPVSWLPPCRWPCLGCRADATWRATSPATCANCHGTNGNVRGKDQSPLAGVSAEKILAQIADYKSGAQPATIMHQISKAAATISSSHRRPGSPPRS